VTVVLTYLSSLINLSRSGIFVPGLIESGAPLVVFSCSLSNFLICGHLLESVFLVAMELEKPFVEGPDSRSVTDGDKGDVLALHVFVQVLLNIDGDRTGALIQNSVFGLVVQKAGHGNALFFASGKHIVPIVIGTPAAFTLD